MKTTLYAKYKDEHGQFQLATATVNPRTPWADFEHYRYVDLVYDAPDKIPRYAIFESKKGAEEWLQRAVRVVTFANISGLRPVQDGQAHSVITVPSWADHQTYWLDMFGKGYVLIEPMEHAKEWISELDIDQFTWQLVPRKRSPYHAPARKDAFSMLLTIPRNKIQLAAIIDRLELAAWESRARS